MSCLFETERLCIRGMVSEDAAFIFELFNAPNWLYFLGDRQVRTVDDARRYIEDIYLKSYEELGFGAWVITDRVSGVAIGICGLFKRPYLALPDLGYAVLPGFEGKGYAVEAAAGTLSYARSQLGQTELLAIVSENNSRSIRLLEKIGYAFEQRLPPEEGRGPLMLYRSTP